MAGNDGEFRPQFLESFVIVQPARHIAGSHLYHDDARMTDHLLHFIEGVSRFSPAWILVDDNIDSRCFRDILDEADGGSRASAEAKPMMGGHEEDRIGTRFASGDRVIDCLQAAFGGHTGDDLNIAIGGGDRIGDQLSNTAPLVGPQGHDFAGVTVAYDTLDAVHSGKFGDVIEEALFVERFIFVKWAKRGRENTRPRQ